MAELPRPGDPLEFNGRVYNDKNGDRYTEVPTDREARNLVMATRRQLADLPDKPNKMNTISVILSYHLFGLAPHEIALATNLDTEVVGRIIMSDAFAEMKAAVFENIVDQGADDVRGYLSAKAKGAAERVFELSQSMRPDIALAASKDILDRGGHSVKQVVEHNHRVDGGLRIEIVKKDVSEDIPTIDVTPEK